jgi:hypothetical protein
MRLRYASIGTEEACSAQGWRPGGRNAEVAPRAVPFFGTAGALLSAPRRRPGAKAYCLAYSKKGLLLVESKSPSRGLGKMWVAIPSERIANVLPRFIPESNTDQVASEALLREVRIVKMVLDSETSLGYSWTGMVSVSSRGGMRSALVKVVKTISFFLPSLPSPQVCADRVAVVVAAADALLLTCAGLSCLCLTVEANCRWSAWVAPPVPLSSSKRLRPSTPPIARVDPISFI